MTNRALVIVGPDGVVRWSHLADSPGDLPGANLIFDGLDAVSRLAAPGPAGTPLGGSRRCCDVAAHERPRRRSPSGPKPSA